MDDREDKVGFGRPPKHGQFKKGQSGNPNGRPKRSTDLNTILTQELDRLVVMTQAGERHEVSVRKAIVKNLIAKAIQGNLRCLRIIWKHIPKVEREFCFVMRNQDAHSKPQQQIETSSE